MTYLVDMLSNGDNIKIAMLMGRSAHEMEDLFSENVKVFTSLHPSSAEFAELKQWDCNDIFNKVNSELESKKLPQIIW
jgi:uracil DNA glycosylase